MLSAHVRSHQITFSASWPRRAEFSSVFLTYAEDARFSSLRFHSALEWIQLEEFPLRFMACDVILETFKRNYCIIT